MRIVSIGYEKIGIVEFLDVLQRQQVTKVIDVRLRPMSRKPDFRGARLASFLESVGIDYVHVKEAGNPFYKDKADLQSCLREYASHVESTPEVSSAVLAHIGEGETVAMLCFERAHAECHRSVLLDFISQNESAVEVVLGRA